MAVQEAKLTIVGWLWRDKRCRTQYMPEHADTWARMLHRNVTIPHRFVLLTDRMKNRYDSLIEPMSLWDDWRDVRCKLWPKQYPQCWLRLKAFSKEMRSILGEKFVSIDLDCVVTGSLDAVLSRNGDFRICHRPPTEPLNGANPYQGSMWMMTTGSRAGVWEKFRGSESFDYILNRYPPDVAKKYLATDQGWMLYALGPYERGWDRLSGVYFWPWLKANKLTDQLPENAKIVFFQGQQKPWNLEERPEWVKQHYQ